MEPKQAFETKQSAAPSQQSKLLTGKSKSNEGLLSSIYEFFFQVKILMRKNYIVYRRRWRSTLLQILVPIIFAVLLRILAAAIANDNVMLHPEPTAITTIPECIPGVTSSCKTLTWVTNSSVILPTVQSIMSIIATDNSIPASQLNQLPSELALNAYFQTNVNQSVAGVVWYEVYNVNGGSKFSYNLYMNLTNPMGDLLPSYQAAIDKAIMKYQAQNTAGASVPQFDLTIRGYPRIPRLLSGEVIVFQAYGSAFFYTAIFFQFIIVLGNVVAEKEAKLRLGMGQMGLRDGAFWFSWFLTMVVINLIASILLVLAGLAMQLNYFLNTNFIVNFALFFLFGLSMTPLAFLFSTFISSTKTASTAGFIVLTVGFLLQFLVASSFTIYSWFDPTVTAVPRQIFMFYPPFQFSKVFADITRLSMPRYNAVTSRYDDGPGYGIEDLYTFKKRDGDLLQEAVRAAVPPSTEAMSYLVMDFFIFYALTLYMDQLFGGAGVKQPFYYPLLPSYWGFKSSSKKPHNRSVQVNDNSGQDDPDVAAEALRARRIASSSPSADEHKNVAILIVDMVKEFDNGLFDFNKQNIKRAVDGTCLVIESNSCISVLGHNGAGKSTTLNMLTGLYLPTSGDALVYHQNETFSILEDMPAIRRMIGVCPQHDILWPELTAYEHMDIFCEFKGVPLDKRDSEIMSRLEDVSLSEVCHKPSSTFSGGMKRRLSVAISCAGSPTIMFLDEPTTGMDPASRRKVWSLIHKMKQGGRVVILTTHSMEEAEALSDRITIMAKGKLCCIGDALRLRGKFGNGYNINVVAGSMDCAAEIKQMVLDKLGESVVTLVAENAGSFVFNLPADKMDLLPPFIEHVETLPQTLVRDFGVSQTTLEEVFIKITKHSEFATFSSYATSGAPPSAPSGYAAVPTRASE